MRAKLLVGELDLNGLIGAFELNSLRHRLVSRACARRLFVFIHKNNQLTNGGASPTALLRLSLQAFLTDHQFVNEIVSALLNVDSVLFGGLVPPTPANLFRS